MLYFGGKYCFCIFTTTIHCYEGLAAESKTAVSNACTEWNGAGVGNLITKGNDHSNTTYPNDNVNNEITKGNRGTSTYLMQTNATSTKWAWFKYYLTEADVDINGSYPWANNGSQDCYDVGACITHEIGHVLGLNHSSVSGASMVSGLAKGDTAPRTIEQDDKDGINDIY